MPEWARSPGAYGTPWHPAGTFTQLSDSHRRAMFLAADLIPDLPADAEVLVAEERPRTAIRDGVTMEIHDATLLARKPLA